MCKAANIKKCALAMWLLGCLLWLGTGSACAQVNTDQVMRVGQNAMYFEDYVLSIQYFNQAIQAKPYLAQPYFLRAVAKFNLEDYAGAEADATRAIDINPFLADAWEVRGVARQNQGKYALAIEDYDQALDAIPRNRQIMFNRAMAIGALKELGRADSAFTQLIDFYPGFENAYLGRAVVRLERGDTIAATADVDKGLQINPNAFNGHLLRSEIAVKHDNDLPRAISEIDLAIKLEPKLTNLYINRAFLRYKNDDYFGAMADYSYALQLDPGNQAARFNRALLRTEVNDLDNALYDYNAILADDPDNDLALYNRAIILADKGQLREAIDDISRVIDLYPTLGVPYFMRSEWLLALGDKRRAKADHDRATELTNARRPITKVSTKRNAFNDNDQASVTEELTPEQMTERFNKLLTVENSTHFEEEYNNSSIRGKVQDRNIAVELEPMMELTFYPSTSELKHKAYYIKELDELNTSRIMRKQVYVTNKPQQTISEGDIHDHFNQVDYFNSYISTHQPRAVDYIARALYLITLRNYDPAIADLTQAITLAPDNALAFMLRAQARHHQGGQGSQVANQQSSAAAGNNHSIDRRTELQLMLADIDRAIEISPRQAVAWFNKGNLLYEAGDLTSAAAAYSRAIELQPDMGEAFYNRGYIYLKLGNSDLGITDLSCAGELGVVSAYNLIKRITK